MLAQSAGAEHTALRRTWRGWRVVVAHNRKAVGRGNLNSRHAWGGPYAYAA